MSSINKQLAYPRVCGLLGVKPSRLSYAMHTAGFRELGLPFTYTAFDTHNTQAGLVAMRELGFCGLSLTIPHKEQALQFIDQLSQEARVIKATNTVINSQGLLLGHNTDCYGVTAALEEVGFSGKGKRALVFGAGGASRAAIFALKRLELDSILLTNRTEEKGHLLAKECKIEFVPYGRVRERLLEKIELFVNATPIGLPLSGGKGYPFSLDVFSSGQTVFDMVTRETELIERVRQNGATPVPGIRMLLYQALPQFELFTEQKAPKEAMEKALLEEAATVD